MPERDVERVQTLVIGGGQAGLATGYWLKRLGVSFLILDAHERVGDAWRKRWDSLRLFTPQRFSSLPGLRLRLPGSSFISKDQMADYLESYARAFDLPVRTGVRVDGLSRVDGRFVVTAGERRFEADHVVVAMAQDQEPRLPAFAAELDPAIVQLHPQSYKNPTQLREGRVLVVGVGNSGGDLALEVSRSHQTWLSGKESGVIPFRPDTFMARLLFFRMIRFIGHRVLTVATPIGRRMRPKMMRMAVPLIRVKPRDLEAAGVERVARVTGVKDGKPLLADGRVLDVSNVIWCTGFQGAFSWIRLPVMGEDGMPRHERGISTAEPGLYFVGLRFLYSVTSDTIGGVGRDAERIVRAIARRVKVGRAA